jgi:hypothetical protein
MNQLEYYSKAFDMIGESLMTRKQESVCPVCGSGRIRLVKNTIWPEGIGQYYTARTVGDIEDYGQHQCECGHYFETVPEYVWNGQPVGMKIN